VILGPAFLFQRRRRKERSHPLSIGFSKKSYLSPINMFPGTPAIGAGMAERDDFPGEGILSRGMVPSGSIPVRRCVRISRARKQLCYLIKPIALHESYVPPSPGHGVK
jgi:hypothetical protein